jgi:phage baseplate assembly protein W
VNRDAHLGVDLLLGEEGDLAVNQSGDLAVVTGRACLVQDIRDRLGTLHGDLYAHSDWGSKIGRLLGASDTPLNRALAVRYLREALESEPRIESESIVITPLTFTSEEKRFEIRFTPVGATAQELLVWGFGVTDLSALRLAQ